MKWKKLNEFPDGLHYISDTGIVKSVDGIITTKRRKIKVKGRIIKQSVHYGYPIIKYKKNGKYTTLRIGRAVGMYFVPNPLNLPEINHEDSDKMNNCASNLTWVDRQQNIDHMIKNRLRTNYWVRKVYQYNESGELLSEYESIKAAANETGFKKYGIARCSAGLLKTYMGYKWQFAKTA